MDSLDYWRLCDEVSVVQASALIVGLDPSSEEGSRCDGWAIEHQPAGYNAAKSALVNAINAGRLPASVRHGAREYGWADQMSDIDMAESLAADYWSGDTSGSTAGDDENLAPDRSCFFKIKPDWNLTTIFVDDLRAWLRRRGITTGFFFPEASPGGPEFLDPAHPRHSKKLAAAVSAWISVKEVRGRSAKGALERWLREHAAEFGLTNDEGNPIETAMKECAAVANWDHSGGAPKSSD